MDFAGNIKRCDHVLMPCAEGYECIGKGMQSVCCPLADRVCTQSVDGGTRCGVAATTRYYFDSNANLCRPFSFSGCGGNENNFKTKGHCLRFCANSVTCLKGEPIPDRYSANRVLMCTSKSHCPKNYTCTGQKGRKACCPSKAYVCGMPYDASVPCRSVSQSQLWTFNTRKGECESLQEGACANQLNTFASLDQCAEYCIGEHCLKDGELAITNIFS
ncbi:Uncharacterized protein ZC84.1 [Toxocara canis]|uniref:Uncharacterized protein ZC84.1 n=1 Tax=Toxocara canis TaxID=6265 RepID=A0A0B2VUB4_TOXCA|nr:Uncharacterized protein ZC84.1 [Toxocara canis]